MTDDSIQGWRRRILRLVCLAGFIPSVSGGIDLASGNLRRNNDSAISDQTIGLELNGWLKCNISVGRRHDMTVWQMTMSRNDGLLSCIRSRLDRIPDPH